MAAYAEEDGSWTTISYLRHIFDEFDVRLFVHAIDASDYADLHVSP